MSAKIETAADRDVRECLENHQSFALIAGAGSGKTAKEAREKAARYQEALEAIGGVHHFAYRDSKYSDYLNGQLGHDDMVEIASYLFQENATFRRITGLRFPYILVDEAQDRFAGIVNGLNLVYEGDGLPVVGYFGDPWQQIYDASVGDFSPPSSGKVIKKTESFRCSESVIASLNAFRGDVEQYAAGNNKGRAGSVIFLLVQADKLELPVTATPKNRSRVRSRAWTKPFATGGAATAHGGLRQTSPRN